MTPPLSFTAVGTSNTIYYEMEGSDDFSSRDEKKNESSWPFDDKKSMSRLKRSAEQAGRGELKFIGSFAKYAEE